MWKIHEMTIARLFNNAEFDDPVFLGPTLFNAFSGSSPVPHLHIHPPPLLSIFTVTPPHSEYNTCRDAVCSRKKVHELIIISLFDEVEFDDRGSGGYLDDEPSIRREKHFLGSVALPFQVSKLPTNSFSILFVLKLMPKQGASCATWTRCTYSPSQLLKL